MLILAVDDDPIILEVLQHYVDALTDHELVTAESVTNAFEILEHERRHFDCFLLDIQMPDTNGIEFCRALREIKLYQRTPILMLTAMTEKSYIDNAFSAGANDYITKPLDITNFKGRLSLVELITTDAQPETVNRPMSETATEKAPQNLQHVDLAKALPIVVDNSAIVNHITENEVRQLSRLSRVTDFATHASEAGGGSPHAVYDGVLERKIVEHQTLPDELLGALANGHFEIYLQPKVKLPQETVYGFEALIRWNRNGHVITPNEFINVAEQSGFIVKIDEFVLTRATTFVSNWNFQHGTNYSVSVNLSALHFNSRRIVDRVQAALASSKLPPQLLTLEITETIELRDWKQVQSVIADMQKIGCHIAIDDFGSGFSSLAYLHATSADELKIDRSLIEDLATSEKAKSIFSSVLEIASNLDMEVVVEGVENSTQAAIVYELGALQVQGYHFGRPQPAVTSISAAMAGFTACQPNKIG
ncbi:EAL domain-containing protein [Yoonia sp.]|uniref:two-component system response regulator n=1 Tax=Yoonia sp. TaxID=2212373 RepID=UPI002393FD2F|nr:EAL domain-containing protein [Yoonia sp.]MDE0852260.1 EAL domain-containing protein [Yoonia sp.]